MPGRRRHGLRPIGLPLADLLAAEMEARSLGLRQTATLIRGAAGGPEDHSRAGVSQICRWRAGYDIPGANHIRLLARAFDLPVELVAAAAAAQRLRAAGVTHDDVP